MLVDVRDLAQNEHAKRYADEIKALALDLWALKANQNASEVSRLLKSGEYGEPVDVPRETVAYWSRAYDWAAQAEQRLVDLAPALRGRTVSNVVISAHSGSAYLRRVTDGDEDHPDISEIVGDDTLSVIDKQLRIEARIKAHALARKDRIAASIAMIDRAGLSPTGKRDPLDGHRASQRESAPLSELSDADLAVREVIIGSGRQTRY